MEIDKNCDGEIEPVNFNHFIQGEGRFDYKMRDISEVDSCEYQNLEFNKT